MDDLVQYCINYILDDPKYTEENRNCQTFAADFFSFLCAKKHTKPYYPLNRLMYVPHRHAFLYEPKEDDEEEMEKGEDGKQKWYHSVVGKHTHKLSIISLYDKKQNVCVIYE